MAISYSLHLSSKKHSLNTIQKVANVSKHNLRKYKSEKYNENEIAIIYGGDSITEKLRQVYQSEFGEALKEYNQGVREDRQIGNYLEHVSKKDKADVAAEIIIQVGSIDFWTDIAKKDRVSMIKLYSEQLQELIHLVPDFKVVSAVVHLDEASPHMHVVGVPVASGYKKGLKKQVAKTQVFNKDSLTMLQDKMRTHAESQFANLPVLRCEKIKEKEKGRNSDWSKEFYQLCKEKELKETEIQELQAYMESMKGAIENQEKTVEKNPQLTALLYNRLKNDKKDWEDTLSRLPEDIRRLVMKEHTWKRIASYSISNDKNIEL